VETVCAVPSARLAQVFEGAELTPLSTQLSVSSGRILVIPRPPLQAYGICNVARPHSEPELRMSMDELFSPGGTFDEIGGLKWSQKKEQIQRRARHMKNTVKDLGLVPLGLAYGHATALLSWCYSQAQRKDAIRRLYASYGTELLTAAIEAQAEVGKGRGE
jgi:hypothetical protein